MRLPAFFLPLFLIIPFTCLTNSLVAQSDTVQQSIYNILFNRTDFFEDDSPFHCTMTFDIKSYQKKKFEGKYMPVKMTYYDIDSLPVEKEFRIKARGTFRRKHCGLPPLWLNIEKDQMQGEQLQGVKKMKVVTHCRGSKTYNQYLLKEFLVYKIYNLISPYSFKVRLTEVKYVDTGRKNKTYTHWAFIIEPEAMMAQRLNSVPLKYDNLSLYHCDSVYTDIMTFFQYLIGNTDYSITGRHNIKLIKEYSPFEHYPIPVPYDFDYSGIVNTHYAVPNDMVDIESVTERYFLGPCRSEKEYKYVLSVVQENENKIFQLIEEFPFLDAKNKNEMVSYLKSFYERAEKKNFIPLEIRSTCKDSPVE